MVRLAWLIVSNLFRLKEHLAPTSIDVREVKFVDLVRILQDIFPQCSVDFDSTKFKTILNTTFNTRLRKVQYRESTAVTVKGYQFCRPAVCLEPSDYSKHYAIRKVNDTDHEYILTYTDTVSVCVSVVNGEVIKTTVNGSMVHGTDHYSLQELLKLLMHCKPCGKRLTANCIQLLSKYTKSVVCRPCQQVQSQRVRKEIQNAKKGMFHRLSYFQRRHTCYSIFSLTSDSHESMTTISGAMPNRPVSCKFHVIDRWWNYKIYKSVFSENLSPTNIKRNIAQVTGSEAFWQHVQSQLEMSSKKRRIYDPM